MTGDIDWKAKSAELDRSVEVIIAGESQKPSGEVIRNIDPADGTDGHEYHAATEQQVDAAVVLARRSGAQWWSMPAAARRGCLLKLAELIEANAAELALHDCLDIGKPISAASMEVHVAASMCRYFAEIADKLYSGQCAPTDPGSFSLHVRKPRGVVAAITPWNYPIINATLKLAPALAAGNAVLLKPSEISPGSAGMLVHLCANAGIPPGTVGFLPGNGNTGAALARHAGVDMLTFTGSTATGKALMRTAGDNALKPLLLECGGKSPEIVFADVAELGVDTLAAAIVGGAMANQGQLCVARSRLYIEEPLYEELVVAIESELNSIRPGHPLDPTTQYGPLASPMQLQRVLDFVDSGITDGASIVLDGRNIPGANKNGCYVGPTLFTNVNAEMRIMRDEIFGPVLCVTPFSGERQALEHANNSAFGLAATIWTRDLARAHRMANQIETGKLHIRSTTEQRFGAGWGQESEPCRQSGFGVEGGQMGVYSYTRLQSVQIDYPLI